jgi:hypothetical protein
MLRGVVVLTAVSYLSTTKIGIIFIYTNILQKKFYFFCVFSLGAVFTYIYASERGRLVAFLGCWVLGAGCSSANWWRIVGRSSGWPFQFLGRRTWPAGGPRGWLHVCRVSRVGTVCKCAGLGVCKCAEPRTCASVQMCRCADICRGCVQMCKPTCANVQGFADIC